MSAGFTIRPAAEEDCADVARLVRALAVFEKLEHEVRATAEDFRRALGKLGVTPR